MKISDPLGKVYTHTMFKKKSYDFPQDNDDNDKRQQSDDDDDDNVR